MRHRAGYPLDADTRRTLKYLRAAGLLRLDRRTKVFGAGEKARQAAAPLGVVLLIIRSLTPRLGGRSRTPTVRRRHLCGYWRGG